MMNDAKIAIIRNGSSDFMVLKSFISSVILNEQNIKLSDDNFLDLDLKIGEAVSKYLINKGNEIDRAKKLKKTIIQVLFTASRKEIFSNKDIIILNSDAEHRLMQPENFYEAWVRELYAVISLAIDEFYKVMVTQGYGFKD